jgi:hypothetical protein
MKCHLCGSKLEPLITDLPFKINDTTIVILKSMPISPCKSEKPLNFQIVIY